MKRMLRSFLRSERGNVAMIFAFGSVAFVGTAALTVDVGVLYYNKTRLQTATDAAALSAAKKLPNATDAQAQGVASAALNVPSGFGTVTQSADVQTGTFTSSTSTFVAGGTNPNAVKVSAHRTATNGNAVALAFANIFGQSSGNVSASSIGIHAFPKACVYALDPTASSSFNMQGGSLSTPSYCGVQVNSSNSQALAVSNNASLTANSICVVGGVSSGGTISPTPTTGCKAKPDPLSYLPAPTASSCLTAASSGTILPGTYCGNTTFSGVAMSSGVYYIQNGSLSLKGPLTGSGVMIYLDQNSSFSVTGSGTITLTAPTSGTYRGISFFQDRSTSSNVTESVSGGGGLSVDGAIYVPSAQVKLAGSSGTSNVGYIVANTITANGSSSFQIATVSGNIADAFSRSYLVQ